MDRARDDADLGPTGRGRARTVGADEAGPVRTNDLDSRDHVERRDAFGDAEDGGDPGVRGLHHGVWRPGGRDEDERSVRTGLADGLGDGVEDRDRAVEGGLAALARGD